MKLVPIAGAQVGSNKSRHQMNWTRSSEENSPRASPLCLDTFLPSTIIGQKWPPTHGDKHCNSKRLPPWPLAQDAQRPCIFKNRQVCLSYGCCITDALAKRKKKKKPLIAPQPHAEQSYTHTQPLLASASQWSSHSSETGKPPFGAQLPRYQYHSGSRHRHSNSARN